MTIQEAITELDGIQHNTYDTHHKIRWLSELDARIKQQILGEAFGGYDDDVDRNTPLPVPEPYDRMYLRYLEAQIHYHNGEYDRYNNAIALFRSLYEDFANHYRRTHLPEAGAIHYF